MILFQGEIYPSSMAEELIEMLPDAVAYARKYGEVPVDAVVRALDSLAHRVEAGEFDELMTSLDLYSIEEAKEELKTLLSEEWVRRRLALELPAIPDTDRLSHVRRPLGTLFHVTAGNVDALPAYSVIEGVLTGNVNIVKLPSADRGISVRILQELIAIEPRLSDMIYVFDTPSQDVGSLRKMARLASAIVIWGGDEAIDFVRREARPDQEIIEWGHKISFAYLSGDYLGRTDVLRDLASHIARTNQLLCTSCQMVYLDTEEEDDLKRFCETFLPILDEAAASIGRVPYAVSVKRSIERYTGMLEGIDTEGTVFMTERVRLTIDREGELKASGQFCDVRVSMLPRDSLTDRLSKYGTHLETAGLYCSSDRDAIVDALLRAGLVRITNVGSMSDHVPLSAHDGRFPLAMYTRIAEIER